VEVLGNVEVKAPGQKRWKVKVLGNGVEKALGHER
jgi:hypothetical protein